jgi:uncharacterized membrane protein YdjX (TVP38/TMEM64 family)
MKRFLPLIFLLLGLVIAYLSGVQNFFSLSFLNQQRDALEKIVHGHYALSVAAFFVVYTVSVACSLPAASILTVFAGFLFGWLVGGLVVVCAATFGATLLFIAARSSIGNFLRNKVSGMSAQFIDGFTKNAFYYLLILRIAPIFPFFIVNIVPVLFNMKLKDYVLATFIGIIPGTFAYTWLGKGVGSVLDAAKKNGVTPKVSDLVTPEITIAFFALAVVAAMPLLIKKMKKP